MHRKLMANRVIHSMVCTVMAKTESGLYFIKPEDTGRIEIVPVVKFARCIFPKEYTDENGLLKDGVSIQCVRVANGWIYPNHKIYSPINTLKIK